MTKIEMAVAIITALCLLGVIALIALGKETEVLMPILTALIGWMVAIKKDVIVAKFSGKKKKK